MSSGFMHTLKVLALLLSLFACQANSLQCYDCTGIDSLSKCNTKVTCKSNEHCHARKYISGGATILYDVNCRTTQLCSRIEQKRADVSDLGDIDMWTSCCASDLCNRNFDSQGYLKGPTPMVCYNCRDITDPADCTQTTTCKLGEACMTHEKISGNKKLFDMTCLPKTVCEGIGYHLQLSRKRHTKRFELCRACCDESDKCNNQFCSAKLGLTGMSALGTPIVPVHTTDRPLTTTTVHPLRPYVGYHLLVKPVNQTGVLGSSVVFDCQFDKPINESMTITWFFRNKAGVVKQIYSGNVNPPSLDFYVKRLSVADEGDYLCEVDYNGHKWTAAGHLTTSGFLQITKGPDTLSVAAGSTATFTCEANGDPKPVITWEVLHNSPHPQAITKGVTATSTGSQLVLNNAHHGDAGVYKCVASSPYGKIDSLAVLNVT